MKSPMYEKAIRYVGSGTIVSLVLVIGVLLWTSFRGLDGTDESFYLLGYINGIEPANAVSLFHRIYNIFFGAFDFSIAETRILRIALSLAASILLAQSFLKFITIHRCKEISNTGKYMTMAALSISSLLGYVWLPQSPSYNTFSCVFLQLILTFYLLGESTKSTYYKYFFAIAVGFFLGAAFYNKFPNAITASFAMILFSLVLRKELNWKLRIGSVVQDVFGYIFGFLVFSTLLFRGSPLSGFLDLISLLFGPKPVVPGMDYFSIYKNDLVELLIRTDLVVALIIGYTIIHEIVKRKLVNSLVDLFLDLVPLFFVTMFILFNHSYLGGASRKFLHFDFYFVVALLFLAILVVHRREFQQRLYSTVLMGLFFGSFLLGAVGTGNGLSVQVMIYLVFLILPLLLIAFELEKATLVILIGLVSIIGSSQIITAMLLSPYREVHSVGSQKFEIKNVKGFNGLMVDSALYKLSGQLGDVRALQPKKMFVFSQQFGVALFSEKTPYEFAWFDEYDPVPCVGLIERASEVNQADLIFAIPAEMVVHGSILQALEKRGIMFPQQYDLLKQIDFEDCQNLRTRGLKIYVHKSLSTHPKG